MNQSKGHIDRDCTEKCKSKNHGDEVCCVITKRCVTDAELCAYIRWKCFACGHTFDSMGRTALHLAASCGRSQLVRWLIRNKGAELNVRDLESGYSALHRSIFYGQINTAVTLIEMGANMGLMDYNDLTPLDHAMKDRLPILEYNVDVRCQVYVWGTNSNYTLGTGRQQARQMPELLDSFHKKYPKVFIKQACLDKFHCVLVSADGRVFSCGHGQGGRLGLNSERTVLIPEEVQFAGSGISSFSCAKASISRDHSVFLSDSGQVWSCGLNTNFVLGIKPIPDKVLVPKLVADFKHKIKNICAARFHSVAWGPDAVYTWGLNGGQLGQQQNYPYPKQIKNFSTETSKIVSVAVSDCATVIATNKGDVIVLHEYQTRRIASRTVNIEKIVAVGGRLDLKVCKNLGAKKSPNELRVLILMQNGNLLIWQESYPQLSRCIYTLNRSIIVRDVALSRTEVFFITADGEAFKGEFYTRKKKAHSSTPVLYKSAFHEFLNKDDCQIIKIIRVPHIHRAAQIQCDQKGRNFVVLQTDPRFLLMGVPQLPPSDLKNDMLNLLNNSDELDSLHNVLFKVGTATFAVHHYIIAMKSPPLSSLIEANVPKSEIELTNLHPAIFKQILLYIYTGECDLTTPCECPQELKNLCSQNLIQNMNITYATEKNETKIDENISAYEYEKKKQKQLFKNKENNIVEMKDPLRLLQEAARRFELKSLLKKIDCFTYSNGYIHLKPSKKNVTEKLVFDRNIFENLHDIVIKCKNGKEISAHKCVLASRLEYFNNFFAARWNSESQKEISLPVKYDVLETIIDFLYTDEAKNLERSEDIDYIVSVLIIADQLFINRLRVICEIALSSFLTLRNAAHMLLLANVYNSMQLKVSAMEFICLNLCAILELRTLESLDKEILDELTEYYLEWNPILSKRVITPYSVAPCDEIVKNVSITHPIDIEDCDPDISDKKPTKNCAKKKRTRKSSNSESSKHKLQAELDLNFSSDTNISLHKSPEKDTAECTGEAKSDSKWIKILTEKEKHQKIIKTRLKAIANAKDEIENEEITSISTKLVSTPKIIPTVGKRPVNSSPVTSPVMHSSPIPQSSSSEFLWKSPKSPPIYDIPIQKAQKLSQKQRKKLAADFSPSTIGQELDKINNKKFSWSNLSFEKSSSTDNKTNEYPDVIAGSPKNPWQKVDVPVMASSPESKQCFHDIVADEKKQRENWLKMRARPLVYIQMEDKAIRDLEKFYNIDEVSDEHITIHKVEKGSFAVPMWVQNTKH